MPDSHAISLFSNCGAGDVGYRSAGFRFDVMAELEPRRLEVCLLNHRGAVGVSGDLRETWPTVVDQFRQRAGNISPDLLAACPPCQRWSSARGKRGHRVDGIAGSREKLLVTVIADVVNELSPRITVVENVPAFLTGKVRNPETKEAICAARLLIDSLSDRYRVFPILVDLCDFGVPQVRRRAFLTFIRLDVPALAELEENQLTPYPEPTHSTDFDGKPITLVEALTDFDLPKLDASSKEKAMSPDGNKMHSVPIWNIERYAMVAAIPPNSGQSAWNNNECSGCGVISASDTNALCPSCGAVMPRPVIKAKNGRYRLIRGFRNSSYSRMKPSEPAPVITTASGRIGSHHTIHPSENRLLSPLECAKLQTFPDNFDWGDALEKYGHSNVRIMIGEAVPPLFTKQHGRVLQSLLHGKVPQRLLPRTDERCTTASEKLELV